MCQKLSGALDTIHTSKIVVVKHAEQANKQTNKREATRKYVFCGKHLKT
jgi:hypothetical protein